MTEEKKPHMMTLSGLILTLGPKKEIEKAFKLFKEAGKKEDVSAQYYLAECYEKGRGVKSSKAKALKWYQKVDEGEDDTDGVQTKALPKTSFEYGLHPSGQEDHVFCSSW